MNLQEYQNLKNKADNLQRDADRLQGSLDLLNKQLKDDYDCNSVKEAEKMLAKLEKEEETANKDYEKAVREFEEKWKDQL